MPLSGGLTASPQPLGAVSRLLQVVSASDRQPVPVRPSYASDRLDLQAPAQLFQQAQMRPVLTLNLGASSQPEAQLQVLGQKYGVSRQIGQSLRQYETQVIQAVIRHKARELGIPERIALSIAANESGLKMWNTQGEVLQGRNIRDGVLRSTDWGVMQINDKAHPKAFPRVQQDLEYNIDYGLSYLARQRSRVKGSLGLGFGDWDRTIASYNLGHNPQSAQALSLAQRYVSKVAQRATQL